ncbi:hypothetical protein O6H91_01G058400 [Diphasiastrum complanatum]|uniref:Uncharacterized protein n=1 Tax=Diphasiastrum complanatum TaxID=34168 RepID=A0ACC2ERK0_DIPCM|nr:hypothetical protein O6H91_01G058400 [Diphasiastrum complanatum]
MGSKEERVLSPGRRPVDYDGSEGWASRIVNRTLAAGAIGVGAGLFMGVLKEQGRLKYIGLMSANFAIAASCFCVAQELVRELRAADSEDLVNCLLGGLASGAVLGRLQGPRQVLPCAILFAGASTGLQYGAIKLREYRLQHFLKTLPLQEALDAISHMPPKTDVSDAINSEANRKWQWPEWFPIQRLDEEAAAKRAKERELRMRRTVDSLQNGAASNETG